jgi:hypothetical protein
MAQTEAVARPDGRPRPWLVVALGIVLTIYLVSWLLPGKSAAPAAAPSNPRVAATRASQPLEPSQLDVQLEALTGPRPRIEGGQRNPFRFYVPPPPPPEPVVAVPSKPVPVPPDQQPLTPPPPIGAPPPPPITLKFIGFMEGVPDKGKVAAFSDCRSTMSGREGDIIDGRYRLVRIGVESVVLEYVDGRGRTTIRMSGQECVSK